MSSLATTLALYPRSLSRGDKQIVARSKSKQGKTQLTQTKTYLEVDAAGVAHERLAEGDATLLAADDAALKHEPVLVDLCSKRTDNENESQLNKVHVD